MNSGDHSPPKGELVGERTRRWEIHCQWRIAGIEVLWGLHIDRQPHSLHHGPSRRHRWHSRLEGKSFGMESGALEREGSKYNLPFSPLVFVPIVWRASTTPRLRCLCGWVVELHPITSMWWLGGDVPCCNRLLMPLMHACLCENAGARRLSSQDFWWLDLVWSYEV